MVRGFFYSRLGVSLVNTDDEIDSNTLKEAALHESAGHGNGYDKYFYYHNVPAGKFYFYNTDPGFLNEPYPFGGENNSVNTFHRLEEAIAEWRAGLLAESIGAVTPTQTQHAYFDDNEPYGAVVTEKEKDGNPTRTVALPHRYNRIDGLPRPYSPLPALFDMVINRDRAHPDIDLFKALFYGNVNREAKEALKEKLNAIDPELMKLFYLPLYSPSKRPQESDYYIFGKELALYMHNHYTPWTAEAVEEAAAVTRSLLPTLEVPHRDSGE